MKAVVTSGAGFLGSHIVEALLLRGDDVIVLDQHLRGKGLSEATMQKTVTVEDDVADLSTVCRAA